MSPFAITGIDNADTTSAISFHLAGSLGLSATFLQIKQEEYPIKVGLNRKRLYLLQLGFQVQHQAYAENLI